MRLIIVMISLTGMPAEVKALLEKHTIDLEKQKANTTKLSKLCLGTLNELEKFEKKQERETSAAPKTEDRIKRCENHPKYNILCLIKFY